MIEQANLAEKTRAMCFLYNGKPQSFEELSAEALKTTTDAFWHKKLTSKQSQAQVERQQNEVKKACS